MLPYAAYLRAYEPLTAFPEPDRSRWAGYAASARLGHRVSALEAEHAEALRRLIAVPPIIAPAHESPHAYIRQADGVIYICPWQVRLRSWLALGRLRSALPPALADTFVPRPVADLAVGDFARWHSRSPSVRAHILTATWHVPLAWFVAFGPPERWLVLGGTGDDAGPAASAAARALVYVTTMAQARSRVARALSAVRRGLSPGSYPYRDETPPRGEAGAHGRRPGPDVPPRPGGPGQGAAPPGAIPRRSRGRHAGGDRREDAGRGGARRGGAGPRHAAGPMRAGSAPFGAALPETPLPAAVGEIEEIGRWLEGFHPRALVELDYGGLVHLADNESLRADQSVAEVAAAITGLETGELELAVAMCQRLRNRWRAVRDCEFAS